MSQCRHCEEPLRGDGAIHMLRVPSHMWIAYCARNTFNMIGTCSTRLFSTDLKKLELAIFRFAPQLRAVVLEKLVLDLGEEPRRRLIAHAAAPGALERTA